MLLRHHKVAISIAAVGIACVTLWKVLAPSSQSRLNDALIDAVKGGRVKDAELWLARGADSNSRDMSSRLFRFRISLLGEPKVALPYPTALTVLTYKAVESDLPEGDAVAIARMLIENGARVDEHYRDGDTPLMVAFWGPKQGLVKLFLSAGANVNARNSYGATPLMKAAGSGEASLVNLLVKSGAIVDDRDNFGSTALRFAVDYGETDTASALIDLGADVNAADNQGNRPLTIARQHRFAQLIALLQRAGAKP